MRRLVVVMLVGALAAAAAAANLRVKKSHSLRELVGDADAVLIGRIKSVRESGGSVQRGQHWYRTKTAEVEVVESFKKVKKGEKISMTHSEIAGEMDVFEGAPRGMFLMPGKKLYLMFLKARGGYRAVTDPDTEASLIEMDRKSPRFQLMKRKHDEMEKLKKKHATVSYDEIERFQMVNMLTKEDGTVSEEGVKKFRTFCEKIPEEMELVEKAREALVEYCRAKPKAFKADGVADKTDGASPVMVEPGRYRVGPFVVDVRKKTYVYTQHTMKKGELTVKWEYAGRFITSTGEKWKAGAPALRSKAPKKP